MQPFPPEKQQTKTWRAVLAIGGTLCLAFALISWRQNFYQAAATCVQPFTAPTIPSGNITSLNSEKFTIIINTFNRPDTLEESIHAFLKDNTPSLQEIVIVAKQEDPITSSPNFQEKFADSRIRFRIAENSLNSRFEIDPDIQTRAVFAVDDDIRFGDGDLEWGFQMWRKFETRIVGFCPRDYSERFTGLHYTVPPMSESFEQYSMVLTNAAFYDVSYHSHYWADEYEGIRMAVDELQNGEDIAFNMIVSAAIKLPPLAIKGHNPRLHLGPQLANSISKQHGHASKRSDILQQGLTFFGTLPLLRERFTLLRGGLDFAIE